MDVEARSDCCRREVWCVRQLGPGYSCVRPREERDAVWMRRAMSIFEVRLGEEMKSSRGCVVWLAAVDEVYEECILKSGREETSGP